MKSLSRLLPWLAACLMVAFTTSATAQNVRVVLKGYDPVAYFTDGKPMKGDARYSYDFDDGRYHFASAQHRDLFKADPDRYMPQFSGYCTGSMARGVRNEGHPEAWVILDGKLYVFGAPDSEAAAKQKAAAEKDLDAFRVKVAGAARNFRKQ
jgi:YHS domain-containing protein